METRDILCTIDGIVTERTPTLLGLVHRGIMFFESFCSCNLMQLGITHGDVQHMALSKTNRMPLSSHNKT